MNDVKINPRSFFFLVLFPICVVLLGMLTVSAQFTRSGLNPPDAYISLDARSIPVGARVFVSSQTNGEETPLIGSEPSYRTNVELSVPYATAPGVQLTIELLGDQACCQKSLYPTNGQRVEITCDFTNSNGGSGGVRYGRTSGETCHT